MAARKPTGKSVIGAIAGSKASGRSLHGQTASNSRKSRAAYFLLKSGPWHMRAAVKQAAYGHSLGASDRAARLQDGAEIIALVTHWTGSSEAAGRWYRSQPIPALGDRTAEALVMTGEAALVREYLDHLSQGTYA